MITSFIDQNTANTEAQVYLHSNPIFDNFHYNIRLPCILHTLVGLIYKIHFVREVSPFIEFLGPTHK